VIALATVAALFLVVLASDGAASSLQDRRPEIAVQDMPSLYEAFAGCRHMGTPVVRMTVLADGSIARHQVVRSSGCAVADKRVVNAIRSWKYRPAIRKGKAVASPVTVTVSW
jgi:TonB family protein